MFLCGALVPPLLRIESSGKVLFLPRGNYPFLNKTKTLRIQLFSYALRAVIFPYDLVNSPQSSRTLILLLRLI